MKTLLLIGGLLIAGVAWTAAPGSIAHSAGQDTQADGAAPWQVGRCYRVFADDRRTLYTFKVLEAPAGQWVRVQADPTLPRVPGAPPQARLWVNADATFAVQEWTCWP